MLDIHTQENEDTDGIVDCNLSSCSEISVEKDTKLHKLLNYMLK